ncbi:MAG TPA: phosphate acyltransferase PlsX [Longimicrobiales bacterium]
MRIALDAMGTDRHPAVEVEGAVQALRELPDDFTLVLVGQRERIEAELDRFRDLPRDRLEVVHATQRIEQGESPATAVRRKPNSSIVVGLQMQKEGRVDAFVSAGSTGAVMAASLLILRPLPGVDRPPVGTVLPTAAEPIVLVDAGANVDSKPYHLVQFARLGAIYAHDVLRRPNPRVGLLNIGEEPEKGDELAVAAHRLLAQQSGLNFIGNVEGRDIITGGCDVLVADGFVGNVLLKFYESIAAFFTGILKREQEKSGARMDLREIFAALDYTEYGGAPLLGVNGISIICHGGSPPRAIKSAIRVALRAVATNMVGHMSRELTTLPAADGDSIEPTVGRIAEGA